MSTRAPRVMERGSRFNGSSGRMVLTTATPSPFNRLVVDAGPRSGGAFDPPLLCPRDLEPLFLLLMRSLTYEFVGLAGDGVGGWWTAFVHVLSFVPAACVRAEDFCLDEALWGHWRISPKITSRACSMCPRPQPASEEA